MYNSSHLSRLLAMEHERQLLAAAERERAAREVLPPQRPDRRPPRRVLVFAPRPRLLRWIPLRARAR